MIYFAYPNTFWYFGRVVILYFATKTCRYFHYSREGDYFREAIANNYCSFCDIQNNIPIEHKPSTKLLEVHIDEMLMHQSIASAPSHPPSP